VGFVVWQPQPLFLALASVQSLSVETSQASGQQPSSSVHKVIGAEVQVASQVSALPARVSVVQESLSSQLVGQSDGGSQVSPGSRIPLPQVSVLQSLSTVSSQPGAQHPSPSLHSEMGVLEQSTLQLAALPVSSSVVQASLSSQSLGQEVGGSQVSPASTTPSPQVDEQSASTVSSQPAGQQPSPSAHPEMGAELQAALQLAALPVNVSRVQSLLSSQSVGQEAGGSQVSPGSTMLFPQLAEQSSSTPASQPTGQQPSPLLHAEMGA
jgi:hypothetical protein